MSNYLQETKGWCRVMPPKGQTQRNRRQESVNREARSENAPPPPPPPLAMLGVAELVVQTNQLMATVLGRLPPQIELWEPHEHRETIGQLLPAQFPYFERYSWADCC